MRYLLSILLVFVVFSCSKESETIGPQLTSEQIAKIEKRAGTVSPDGLHLVEWFDKKNNHRGYKWIDPEGLRSSHTVWEVDTQTEFHSAQINYGAGDSILIIDDEIDYWFVENVSNWCKFDAVTFLGAGATINLSDSVSDGQGFHMLIVGAAEMVNFTIEVDSAEEIKTILSVGDFTEGACIITSVDLPHADDGVRILFPTTPIGSLQATFNGVTGIVGGREDISPRSVLKCYNGTQWHSAYQGNCEPGNDGNGTIELYSWGVGTDIFSIELPGNVNSQTLVGFSGGPFECKADVKYKFTQLFNNKKIATFEIQWGETDVTDNIVVATKDGAWYKARVDVSTFTSCEFVWRGVVTLCDGDDPETEVVGSTQNGDIVCGLCQ